MSLIDMATFSLSWQVLMMITPPGFWQASAALVKRFSKTCLIWSGIAMISDKCST
jgi:hypothetical protein